jgi:hypothetical protein
MATNKYPWVKNLLGAGDPLIMPMKAAAGSTRTFKMGEILTFNENAGYVTAVDAIADAAYSLVIAAEEQKADDPARYIPCFMLREGDVFEFALATADAVEYGEGLSLTASQSQQLTVDVDGVCVAHSVGTDNVPQVGTTISSKSYVQAVFNPEFSYLYKNILQKNLVKVMAKTAAYTLTLEDCGAIITNKGATGSVTITAPTSTVPVGYNVKLMAAAAQALVFDPKPDTAKVIIAGGAQTAGLYASVTDEGDFMHLVWDGTDWLAYASISGADGDITIETP